MTFIPLLKHPEVNCVHIFCGENPTQTCIENFKNEICKCCSKDEKETARKTCLKICNPNISHKIESYDKIVIRPGWLEDFRRPDSKILFTPEPVPKLNWILYSLFAVLCLIVAIIIYWRLFRII